MVAWACNGRARLLLDTAGGFQLLQEGSTDDGRGM